MSNSKYNYLPFVMRDMVTLTNKAALDGADLTAAVRMSALAPNTKGRAILGDMEILFYYLGLTGQVWPILSPGNNFLARIGWSRRGYLTEERIPYNILANGYRPWWATWRFPRPYRMYPGDKLRVEYQHTDIFGGRGQPFAVGFHGVQLANNLPVMLTGMDEQLRTGAARWAIDEPSFGCPKNTAIELSAMSLSEVPPIPTAQGCFGPAGSIHMTVLQVYDSANRAWFSQQNNLVPTGVITGYENEAGWLTFFAAPIVLGEERGWVHDESEALIVDLECAPLDNTVVQVVAVVTLRGSLEVEDKHA